jgi:hypothetical protein
MVAGGGSSGGRTPTSPTGGGTTQTQQNRAPAINTLNLSPTFGIAELTRFDFNVTANDPDGDALTYTWDVAGNAFSGTSGSITFSNGFDGTARVTVSDGKGGSISDTRTFVVGSMTGTWRGTNSTLGTFQFVLTQLGGRINGTYSDTSTFGPGKIDPSQPGTTLTSGQVEMRTKQGIFTDFTFRGTMDQTGKHITGGIFGSGFTGQPFTMDKQ